MKKIYDVVKNMHLGMFLLWIFVFMLAIGALVGDSDEEIQAKRELQIPINKQLVITTLNKSISEFNQMDTYNKNTSKLLMFAHGDEDIEYNITAPIESSIDVKQTNIGDDIYFSITYNCSDGGTVKFVGIIDREVPQRLIGYDFKGNHEWGAVYTKPNKPTNKTIK